MSKVYINTEPKDNRDVADNMNAAIAFVTNNENNPDALYRMAVACVTGLGWHNEAEALDLIAEHVGQTLELNLLTPSSSHRAGVKAILDLAAAGDTEAIARLKFLAEKYAP